VDHVALRVLGMGPDREPGLVEEPGGPRAAEVTLGARCDSGFSFLAAAARVCSHTAGPLTAEFALPSAEALAGLWHALDAFWVNDPARDHVAHRKVLQLRRAQECGLTLPDTLITNDPARARMFVDGHGYRDVVYKAFSALEHEWRETRLLRHEELGLLDYVRYAPVIFQEYVEAVYDLRVTIVGDSVFPAAIHSQETSYPVDFRMDMTNATIRPVDLPADVEARLKDYMRALGLQYGAIDMRLRPDGTYVFLEINPAGQWLFVEQVTEQPIAATLARLLVQHDRSADPADAQAASAPLRAAT
jgi:glutathione synthase/RimK-type ligase-like ATP-grasp enzyme